MPLRPSNCARRYSIGPCVNMSLTSEDARQVAGENSLSIGKLHPVQIPFAPSHAGTHAATPKFSCGVAWLCLMSRKNGMSAPSTATVGSAWPQFDSRRLFSSTSLLFISVFSPSSGCQARLGWMAPILAARKRRGRREVEWRRWGNPGERSSRKPKPPSKAHRRSASNG
jgi:hypothetical protein